MEPIARLIQFARDTAATPAAPTGAAPSPDSVEPVAACEAALRELIESKDAHAAECEKWARENPPLAWGDPRATFSSEGLTCRPAPGIDAAVARMNAAWDAARAAMQETP